VALQLDYYMSSQFAGVAVAMRRGLYAKAGIELEVLPTCPPGEEAKVVSEGYSQGRGASLWVGCMEQNTLLPSIASGCKVKAVAAMFGRSPLCLASMPGSKLVDRAAKGETLRVGVHTDTEDLVRRILPRADVRCLPRSQKLRSLLAGEIDAVQAYDVMETLRLARSIGQPPEVARLEEDFRPDVSLGYAQVLFTPRGALGDADLRGTLRDFLRATFDGWREAMQDPEGATDIVLDMQGQSDHWIGDRDFVQRSTQLCCDYVKRTRSCGELGIIDGDVWRRASTWLGGEGSAEESLDGSVWAAGERIVDAHPVAREVNLETRRLAREALAKHGRPPRLVVVTVGSAPLGRTHPDGPKRLQLLAPEDASWFSKEKTGRALGVEVLELDLPESATTHELVRLLKDHPEADGIQLMWPLPPTIDAREAYAAIPSRQDVDGAHFPGRLDPALSPEFGAHPPVACCGVLRTLEHYGVSIDGRQVLVIGRSWLTGQPLASLLASKGATVTLAHSGSRDLDNLCGAADIVISAVGKPGLVNIDRVKSGAVVVNIGTTFAHGDLVPDILPAEDDTPHHAELVVRSVGPISVATLLRNVAENAAMAPACQV